MANFEILSLYELDKWEDYFHILPIEQQDIYFTPKYNKLYEEYGEGKALCFVYKNSGNLAIYPFLINPINTLGFNLAEQYFDIQGAYGYNGIITNNRDSSFIRSFYESFNAYCLSNNIIAEYTRFHPLLKNEKFSQNNIDIIYDRETVVIDLTKSYADIWNTDYSSKNRNMIRKAKKSGYQIEILSKPDEKAIGIFADIYEYSMNKANADSYYFFNRRYFYNIFHSMPNNSFLFNVLNSESEVVCSSIFFHYNDFFHYHLSGRVAEADNSVNNFLIDEAAKYAQNLGAKFFHLGGGRSSDEKDSLMKFKAEFSPKRLKFYIGKKIHDKAVYEEVIRQWIEKHPENEEKYKNRLLKYRY